MKFTIGFSPCPNDTYIFDALVNKKIDTGKLEFEAVLEDVETLNKWAIEGKLDITKLSFPAFFQAMDKYVLMSTGAALGKGVGPLLVAKSTDPLTDDAIKQSTVALPGSHTTANLLFDLAYPGVKAKKHLVFSAIEEAVVNGETDLGVIIHENRFTYQAKGLNKVIDLGEYWETRMHVPVPLGGIAISQDVRRSTATEIQKLIRASLDYANQNYPKLSEYVTSHAQSMNADIMRQHIELYVNKYSLDLGEDGRAAIGKMYETYVAGAGGEPISTEELFLA